MRKMYSTILLIMLMSMVGANAFADGVGVGVDGSRGIMSVGGQADPWNSEFWIVSNEVLHEGDKVHVPFELVPSVVVDINEENFPDENFRNYLLEQDYGADGILTEEEINGIGNIFVSCRNISSLQGIEYFTSLIGLSCSDNQLTSLDVSNNTELAWLSCSDNQLMSLDVSKNTVLTTLECYGNQIKGELMDEFINSLPQGETGQNNALYIYNSENDGNVCTKAQVAAAKAKGWTPYYYPGGKSWLEYEGCDEEANVNAIQIEKHGKAVIYTLDGKRMNATTAADLPTGIYIINGKKVTVK